MNMCLTDEMTNSLENFKDTLLGSMMQVKEQWAAASLKNLWENTLDHLIEPHVYLGNIYDNICYCDFDAEDISELSLSELDTYVDESYYSLIEEITNHVAIAEQIYGAISASFDKFEDMWVLRVKFGAMENEQVLRYLEIL